MSYGVKTVNVHKKLKLDKRQGSENWYARLTLDHGKRIVRSTKTDNFEEAKERALELYYETQARIKNKLPAQTRKFKLCYSPFVGQVLACFKLLFAPADRVGPVTWSVVDKRVR